jgi:hypothetical protein
VLRPATTASIDRLRRAAFADDRELDSALVGLGVLPPVDLEEIRGWLKVSGIDLVAGTNADGHRVIAIMIGQGTVARVHPDGRVVPSVSLRASA